MNNVVNLKNLTGLKWESSNDVTFQNADFQLLAKGCPYLENLFIDQTPNLTDEGIFYLASGCQNLRELFLSDCPKIGDASLRHIAKYCPQLQVLILGNRMITDSGLTEIARNCVGLRSLILLDAVYSANQLYSFITDVSFLALAQYCPHLESLCISDVNITDQGLLNFRSLVDLNIRGCNKVTAVGINAVITNCFKLSALAITEEDFNPDDVQIWRKKVYLA